MTPDSVVLAEYYQTFFDSAQQVARTALSAQKIKTPSIEAALIITDTISAARITGDTILATSVVTTPKWRIPDYVFEPGYARKPLSEVESFVRANRHLPDVPSAKDIAASGLDLAEMSLRLLKNVEELTLHVIDLDKKNARLEEELEGLKADGRALSLREDRP